MLSRMLRWLRDAWVVLGLVLLLVLAADAALRSFLPGDPWPRQVPGAAAPDRRLAPAYDGHDWAGDYWREHAAAKTLRWSPYVYWRRQPFAGSTIHVDARGIRRSWAAPGASAATVWVLGGSSVWGTGVRDEDTLPSALARALAEAGLGAEVLNLGESGYVSGQSLANLARRLGELPAPDLLIFVEGANDVFSALQSGVAGLPQNEAHRARDFRATDGVEHYLEAFPRALEGLRQLAGGAAPRPEVEALADAVAAAHDHHRRLARALADAYGAAALHVWQPTVFGLAQPSAFERAVIDASLADHVALQRAVDARMRERGGAVLLPGPAWAAGVPERFIDFVHLGPAGNEALARSILPAVLAWWAARDGAPESPRPASGAAPDPAAAGAPRPGGAGPFPLGNARGFACGLGWSYHTGFGRPGCGPPVAKISTRFPWPEYAK